MVSEYEKHYATAFLDESTKESLETTVGANLMDTTNKEYETETSTAT